MTESGKPAAFADLPAEDFPFTMEFRVAATGKLIDSIEVRGPGPLEVPGYFADYGPVMVRTTFPGGRVTETWP